MDDGQEQEASGYLIDCVATPGEVLRTAMRILILNLHKGLSAAPATIRQSPEAQRASQALYAASDFFNNQFEPQHMEGELRALSAALAPLVVEHGCDPFLLHLYATGGLRGFRRKPSARPLHRT